MEENLNLSTIMKKEQRKMQKLHQELLEIEKKVVGELDLSNEHFQIPKQYELSKTKRRLTIKMPYMSRVDTLCKGDFQVQTQQWFRQKGKDNPYIPEGFVIIDNDVFRVLNKEVKK